MNLWKNYKSLLYKTFPDLKLESEWATWEGKGTNLTARTYTNPYFIKSREVDIWSDKSCIYNTIIYPKTGSNLPCFGMDLMGFFEKKVIKVPNTEVFRIVAPTLIARGISRIICAEHLIAL